MYLIIVLVEFGYYNRVMGNFGHLNPERVVLYLNLIVVPFMVHFYGNITVMDLEEYIFFHITYIDVY